MRSARLIPFSGVRTARTDIKLIEERLEAAKVDYEARYGEKTD